MQNKGAFFVAFISPAIGDEEQNLTVKVHRDLDEVAQALPPELYEFRDLFSEQKAKEQPRLPSAVHTVNTKDGEQVPYRGLYHLNPDQSRILYEYIKENLRNGRIRHSESPAGAPMLFVPKPDGTLRLCVDYRGLNKITIKNRYPLPLVSELLATLAEGCVFSKLDARDAYHRIRIAESDQWKTAFRTKYGHYEYTVMPFRLTNALATFQAYIHQALAGLIDVCCVVYLDDIIVFSKNREDHMRDLASVMHRLRDAELYLKISKCRFFQTRIDFLGFIVTSEGIEMDPARVAAVAD
ncbi:RNA-directed DNA polymerase [Candidatus Bathyarchaeota archaeon]|nr:RNA-directed DNA polymerase [Candidatus Bathyarchaeota archaeon]